MKIDAFYAFYPESFCDKNHAIWKVFVFSDSVYENTDQKDTTRLGEYGKGEWDTRVVVERQGKFNRSNFEVMDEKEIFGGAENNLIMTQTYTHEFQCIFNLWKYPFDTQVFNFLSLFQFSKLFP